MNGMEISLTFDDGPDPNETPRVLAALQRAQALATFFVITPQARRHPRLISEIQAAGHEVQFHCVEHISHTDLTKDQGEKDASAGLGVRVATAQDLTLSSVSNSMQARLGSNALSLEFLPREP